MQKQKSNTITLSCFLSPLFALNYFFCYLAAITKCFFLWINFCYCNNISLFITKTKISFYGAYCKWLVYMPANQVPAKDIKLKVAIQDEWA